MLNRIKLLFFLMPGLLLNCQTKDSAEKILVVFAHPDDETTIGPILAKYGQTDSVFLLLATDGRFGVTDHMGIPAGDSLVSIRKAEAVCSCNSLGINPPILLDLQDGLGLNGHGNFYEQVPKLKRKILFEINRINPTTIITFGPDGDTGHPDHRLVGGITTELFLQEGLMDQIDLYFFGWSKPQAEKYAWWELNFVHEKGLDTEISYSERDKQKAIESIQCYKSQYTQAEMERWIEAEKSDHSNRLFFRKLTVDTQRKTAF